MGMTRDMTQQRTLVHVDDVTQCNCVKAACKMIYKKNYAVNSKPVERLLEEHSLVSAMVYSFSFLVECFVDAL